ncbi:hypothetical protein JB92DRAFT_3289013 [Gautieria morchelliformis]|nr:hypothetical protein JB92DRAFT_3289013 [Gautieria morchelliformis]
MAKTSSKQKAAQKVTSRVRDTPDPSLVIPGQRMRKPSERAKSAEIIVTKMQATREITTLSDVPEGSEPEDKEAASIASRKETSDYEPVAAPSEESDSDDEASNVSIDSEPVKAKVAAKPASKPSIKQASKGPHDMLEEVTQALYSIIGCTNIHKSNLPALSCQFSKDPLKVKYKLSEDNWDFIKEYQTEVQKKWDDAKIDISLPPQVMGSKNLYSANDEYIDEEDQLNMDAHYFPSYQMLEARVRKELSKCQLHKGELCKINKHNKHQRISNVLLREWVEALVHHDM